MQFSEILTNKSREGGRKSLPNLLKYACLNNSFHLKGSQIDGQGKVTNMLFNSTSIHP